MLNTQQQAMSIEQASSNERYQVVDDRTGDVMGIYSTRKKAMQKRNKLDDVHGSARYSIITIQAVADRCPHCEAPVAEEGCSNGLCEATN